MPHGTDELAFLTRIPAASSTQEVCLEIGKVATRLNMPTFSVSGIVPPGHPINAAFHYHNWSETWMETYERLDLASVNPFPRVVAMASRTLTMTEYREGKAGFYPPPESERLFQAAAAAGRGHHLIVPIHGPRGPRGWVSFSGPGPDPDLRARGILSLLGHVAFARLAEIAEYRPETSILLSRHESAVLRALGHGKTDREIAAETGVTVRTVRFHLSNARRKLGARTRAEALATAARNDLLGEQK